MKAIEIVEKNFRYANFYFLLMWSAAIFVWLVSFANSNYRDRAENEFTRANEMYSKIILESYSVRKSLQEVVVNGPHYESVEKTFSEIRANTPRALRLLQTISSNIADNRKLTTEERVSLNKVINPMIALLFYNENTLEDSGYSVIEGKEGLSLVEHGSGTLNITDKIDELHIEDAVRFLWLSSVPMREILAHESMLLKHSKLKSKNDIKSLQKKLLDLYEKAESWNNRNIALNLWKVWTQRLPKKYEKASDRAAWRNLTISQPGHIVSEASKNAIQARYSIGDNKIDFALPYVSSSMYFIDLIKLLPFVIPLILILICFHLSVSLRFLEKIDKCNKEPIGDTPYFCTYYSIHTKLGKLLPIILISAPLLLVMHLIVKYVPNLTYFPNGFGRLNLWAYLYWTPVAILSTFGLVAYNLSYKISEKLRENLKLS